MLPLVVNIDELRKHRQMIEELHSAIKVKPISINWSIVNTISKALPTKSDEKKIIIKGGRRSFKVDDVEVIIADTVSIVNNYMSIYSTYAVNVMRISRVIENIVDSNKSLIYIDPFAGTAIIILNHPTNVTLADAKSLKNTIDSLTILNAGYSEKSEAPVTQFDFKIDVMPILKSLSSKSDSVYIDVDDDVYYIIKKYMRHEG
ncbi:hypothetical protein [Caldivirga maquilingensis]|uniref:Uncharacterized protein n=1 Tax=Caldivirga maquilingensis (strain ATCC 700844 / DSM 13496 / JCM 10307 / IC-167) TaxID=397948 RepID=A8MAG3_CALMQ|nr:hypothetical protein [Caldivirga maquilingensis]ABW02540.1 hypothetical protein Cmaq_1717 [Caldivirga maquilingensis IC-167]